MAAAEVKIKGTYGDAAVAHNCMEAHGQICQWTGPDHAQRLVLHPGRGRASPGSSPRGSGIPAANVHVMTEYMGGGFGSKFSVDRWGIDVRQAGQDGRRAGQADAGPPRRD